MTVPSTGWYVEVVATGGYTHTPRVADSDQISPQYPPRANARPEVRVPVPKADKWRDMLDATADVSMRVWRDGQRLPIDTLQTVESSVVQNTAYSVLVGRGGDELGQRVTESYDQKAVHLAAQDLVDTNTTYATNVDAPATTTETNTTLLTLSSQSAFLSRVSDAMDTDVWEVANGNIQFKGKTCFTVEGEDWDRENNTLDSANTDKYSNGNAVVFDGSSNQRAEYDFTLAYDAPEGSFEVFNRNDATGSDCPNIKWFIDDQQFAQTNDVTSLDWKTVQAGTGAGNDVSTMPRLEAGDHTLKITSEDGSFTESRVVDVVAPHDTGTRYGGFSYTLDNTLNANQGYLDGPEFYPDVGEVEVPMDAVVAPQAVTGGRAEATLNGGDANYTHFLSNDQGTSFTSGTGTNFESDSIGTSWGPSLTYKAGIARWGSTTGQTPLTGINGHELQSLTLKADLEDMPLLVNTTVDGHIDSILADQFATAADAIWTLSWTGSNQQLEWTAPGQRTTDSAPGIAQYQVETDVGSVYQKAVVYGQADVPRTDVRFQADHGNAVSLPDDRLQAATVSVSDPDTGEVYRINQDYTLDAQAGTVTTLAAGAMSDGSTYTVDYRYQAYGEFDDGTADPAVADAVEIPGLRTDFACEQAARLIVNEVNDIKRTATATIPAAATNWSVVESLDPPIVPTDGNALHVKRAENTPRQTVLTLGNRRDFGDVVERIRTQVNAVSRKA